MAVTPLNANARLQVNYTSDLPHKMQFLCSIPTTYAGNLVTFSGAGLTTAAAMAHLLGLVQPIWSTSTEITSWILERHSNGAYVEVDTGSFGVHGTDATAISKASEATYVFFDSFGVKVRNRQLGIPGLTEPFKQGYGDLSGPFKAWVDDFVPGGIAGHLGDWVSGRSGTEFSRFISLVAGYNRKSRRRLGVV